MKQSEMLKKITSRLSTGEVVIDGNKIAQVLAEMDEIIHR
jgi:hypothetical protein